MDRPTLGKENSRTGEPNEQDYRQNLFSELKKSGIIDGIKSQLRVQLLNRLQGKLGGKASMSLSKL